MANLTSYNEEESRLDEGGAILVGSSSQLSVQGPSGQGCFNSVLGRTFCHPSGDGDKEHKKSHGKLPQTNPSFSWQPGATPTIPTAAMAPNTSSFDDTIMSLGKEFAELSMAERTKIDEEIHGITTKDTFNSYKASVDETGTTTHKDSPSPEFVEKALKELHSYLSKKRGKIKDAYKRACLLAPKVYGPSNRDYHLLFLESSAYDPREAARKIIENLHYKSILFGEEKVAKMITLDDFDEDDMAALRSGQTMFLPCNDMSGRPVLYQSMRYANTDKIENHMRVLWYLMMTTVLHNPMARKNGIVTIADLVDCSFSMETFRQLQTSWLPVYKSFPEKFAAIHLCVNDSSHKDFVQFVLNSLGKRFRIRIRIHFGKLHYMPVVDDGMIVSSSPTRYDGTSTIESSVVTGLLLNEFAILLSLLT